MPLQKQVVVAGDNFGINIGSSRGPTGLFEKHQKSF